ncbi:glucans biosynthesis protein G precursor [Piscinibacter sakaiensis]|uniref:Glucans biosynthesis protein G n=1 Tax=Piscinibacter sakaiensis TaxID=1547922 RepID=A0A0K8NXH9_PISS1|nr:glucans biosynthesis protein G precursor [Piscinibacter sakaiensis]
MPPRPGPVRANARGRWRRALSGARQAAVAALLGLLAPWAAAFGFDDVAAQAAALAQAPAPAAAAPLPAALQALDYDQLRDIRFRPERALWRREGLPFEVMFFHRGKYAADAVRVHELVDGRPREIGFDPADYDYGRNRLPTAAWSGLGHAGFRVHTALNASDYKDELVVFLGASYFRALGRGQHYGLSARGLAIDTVGAPAGQAEEFPRFTAFWLERPAPGARELRLYALLESARATGAYAFVLRPGATSVAEVRARLYLRAGTTAPAMLGLAPLTSMFQHGENQPRPDDFRPEVHDSDGLSIRTGGGEWLWRPLANPARPLASSFAMERPLGFGLMQRDRDFARYEDTEARYDRRPSAWVEPIGDWGPGRVELLMLPTPDETHDNIAAYWVPRRLPAPGEPLDLQYRLHWQGDDWQRPPSAWVEQTRAGRSYAALGPDEHQFAIDFRGPALAALPAGQTPRAVVTADANGRVLEAQAYPLPPDLQPAGQGSPARWRLHLRVRQQDPARPVELRAFLQSPPHALTETWTHVIPAR